MDHLLTIILNTNTTMKLTIILNLLLFFAISATAQIDLPQGCNATSDSIYITKLPNRNKVLFGSADSIYYLTRDYICEDGREGAPRAPIGDSTIVMNNLKNNAVNLSRQWANSVIIASMKNEAIVNPVRTMNRTTTALFNTSIYPEIAKLFPDSLFLADYRLTPESGTAVDATITKNAQGQFRLRWGASNNKHVLILSDVHMRVLQYSGTKDLDLVRRNPDTAKWVSDTGVVTIVNKKLQAQQQAQASTAKNK